jgi:hypothetical protein
MAWKSYGNNNQQNQSDSIENMVVQSSVAFQLSSIMKEVQDIGSGIDSREKSHKMSAKLLIISLIFYCAKQVNGKTFTEEEEKNMWVMEIPQLMAQLSLWQGESGMMLSKPAKQTNFFSKMEKYWLKVLQNRKNYIANDQAKYKIIIVGADKVTQQDVDDADEITEEALEDLKARKDIMLKPQPSKLPPKTQDKAESEEMPKESPESVPEAENEAKT